MRRLSGVYFGVVAAALVTTLACVDSSITAPASGPTARVPWGPLGTTGGGNTCGETDLRIADPESILKGNMGVAADEDDCPPPNFSCPQNLTVTIPYIGDTFVGAGSLLSAGAGFGTYTYIAFDINPLYDPFEYYIAGTIQYTLWQCWRLTFGATVGTLDYTIDESELPPI